MSETIQRRAVTGEELAPDVRAPCPTGNCWTFKGCLVAYGEQIHVWVNGDIRALASWHAASPPKPPCRQLSISRAGARASDDVVRGVLADFKFEGAEEDNHSSGVARHFWLDEGRTIQPECECKQNEETVIEPDGYRWQRTKGGA